METILVIDDDDALRCALLSALKSSNYRALGARNGVEGVQIAATKRPDLILCDLNMGENCGYECIEKLGANAETAGIPVILMTGQAIEKLPGVETLMKPFSLPALISAVKRQLRRSINHSSLANIQSVAPHVSKVPRPSVGQELAGRSRQRHSEKPSVKQLEALLAWVQFLREEERNNISRVVHDDLSQKLTVLALELSSIDKAIISKNKSEWANETESIHKMKALVMELIGSAQEIMAQLRPKVLDEFGFVAALEWLVQDLRKKSLLECEIVLPSGEPTLPAPLAAELFRLTQEILSHAITNSSKVIITVRERNAWLHIEVLAQDVDEATQEISTELNLLAIRERAEHLRGRFNIARTSGSDVRITVSVPL